MDMMGMDRMVNYSCKCRSKVIFFLVALILLFSEIIVCPSPVFAVDALIKDMVVANSDSRLLLYLAVENAFSTEMDAGIKNGIPVTFTFYIDLIHKQKDLPDQQLTSYTFDHVLSYDNLKDEYQVKMMEKPGRITASKTLAEAQKSMAEINGLQVTALETLTKGILYTVRVKVKISKQTLPLNMQNLLPFWKAGDIETEYRQIDFKY